MTSKMNLNNLNVVGKCDVYKFVVGSIEDLQMAYELIIKYDLTSKCLVYLSPVSGILICKKLLNL